MSQAKLRSSAQLELLSSDDFHPTVEVLPFFGPTALEDENFPFELISDIAERESWRKEINRPIYHVHKWWAQRLGSVFRAIIIGALTPSGTNVFDAFYERLRLPKAVVFDPFMGSGTTIGEAVKLGARAVGRDINPVAHFLVRNALAFHERQEIIDEFDRISVDVSEKIKAYYKTELPDAREAIVLYWFWVKTASCPDCLEKVDLFGSRIFARHAYPQKHPECRATCPDCGGVNVVRYNDNEATCQHCSSHFDPQQGNANGQKAKCPACGCRFQISKAIRESNQPPNHRLYAKLVLLADGTKEYHEVSHSDHALYEKASEHLKERANPFPVVSIEPGYNTNQALGYNYRAWHEMFNNRQLLCLSILSERIQKIEDQTIRELFTCLFSGALEFNNMFASYKGEGTGAVRHMFAHHVLKPERVPLEANLWGTAKSSGSFMTMFHGRIMRALEYAGDPFELKVDEVQGKKVTSKIYGLSEPIGFDISTSFAAFQQGKRLYLSCGDSSCTDIETGSIDAVITDPPFFDNVHYSQLADFFHVWQRHILGTDGYRENVTTRSDREVQNSSVVDFTDRLQGVWTEAARVLKDDGILAFTYHHSRSEGWSSVLRALSQAGLVVTASQPIKAEMSVAMPKLQAKEPINLDIVVVCRKRGYVQPIDHDEVPWEDVERLSRNQISRFRCSGRKLSRNDVRIIVMGQLLKSLSSHSSFDMSYDMLINADHDIEKLIEKLHEKKEMARQE